MKLHTSLEDIKRPVSLCIRDGMCTYGEWPRCYPLCPIYARHRVFTASGGGLVCLAHAVAENRVGYTSTLAEFAYECTLCEACDMCEIIPLPPPHVGPVEVIRFLRHQLVREGMIPEPIAEKYGEDRGTRVARFKAGMDAAGWIREADADTVLLVESPARAFEGSSYAAAVRLVSKIGQQVGLLEAGPPIYDLYDLGFWDELEEIMYLKSGLIRGLAGKDVLFVDPHGLEFFARRYGELAPGNVEMGCRHFSQFLADAVAGGRLKARKERIAVSYHDPCHLSRGMGISEEPRDLLSFLGVELLEMKRSASSTYCCGAAGIPGVSTEFSRWCASERLEEFRETGADLLITACPHCKEMFREVLPEGDKNRVKDLLEFVDQHTD